MRHLQKKIRLVQDKGHTTALIRNLAMSVIIYEKIKTTEAKAKAVHYLLKAAMTAMNEVSSPAKVDAVAIVETHLLKEEVGHSHPITAMVDLKTIVAIVNKAIIMVAKPAVVIGTVPSKMKMKNLKKTQQLTDEVKGLMATTLTMTLKRGLMKMKKRAINLSNVAQFVPASR